MKKRNLTQFAFLLLLLTGWGGVALAAGTGDDDYNTGDTYNYGGRDYTISGSNLFSNGGFEDGVTGWKANFYTQDASLDNFTYSTSGGYNDGAYITVITGVGAENVHTPCQAIQVEKGAMYLFVGYTKGTKPDNGNLRYNGLLEMSSTTAEVLQSGTTGHDAVVVAQLKWGDGTEWTKTEQVFIAPTDYVGARFTWCNGASFDGMQLYKIEDTSSETLSSDDEYKANDTYVDGNTTYTVKSGNLVTNGGFKDSSLSGWVGTSYTATTTVTGAIHNTTGGFNNGAYVTLSSSGADNGSTPHQAISVEDGKMYLFIGYTSGTTVTDTNKAYNCLFKLTDNHTEDGYWTQLNWGVEAGVMTTSWTKTEYVFTAESGHPYVGIRLGWSGANYDGFQLYEIEEAVVEVDDDEYKKEDEYSGGAFKVLSDNLFVNGGFNDGVNGWTAGGYETAADISNFTIHTTGGYNGGAYLTSNQSAGATSEHTISQAIQVETGAYYLFIGYTSGAVPQARYSALFEMSDATTEANHEESDGNSYSNEIVRLTWGDDNATEWTKTESVFLATTDYVGMRMGWTTGSYDGFQLYKLEAVVPEDASPENPVDLTSLIINPDAYLNSSEGWTCSSEGSTLTRKSGEHWSGTSTSYFDSDSWSGYLWEEEMTQDITLPYAGVYKLTAAGRSSLSARTVLYAGDMEYTFPAIGATGGTIATDGTEWESVEAGLAAGKEFANSDQGYGWNWGSVEIVAASAGKLTIGARFEGYESETHQWASIVNFKLAYLGSSIDAVKDALATDIADAKEIDITTNVGTAPFMRPQELADALTAAIAAAETALEDGGATDESLTAALTALQAAVHDFDNAELNTPAEGETFSIVLVQEGSEEYNGLAVQSDTGNESAGGYAFHFTNTPNRNYAPQNYTFTPNSSKLNGYTISFVDENNTTHYICLGTAYSGGTNLQIRATESAESAYVFQVVPGATEGTWHIYNSDNGKNVGNGNSDGGLYTGSSGDSLQLVSNAIPVNITKAGWTTLVLPYDAELPSDSDLKAYTIKGKSDTQENAVTLTEVEDGELKAKTPYLISGTDVKEYAINGTSTIFDLSTEATDDYLVGTWTDISSVATGNYVLQYQPEAKGTAFYIVDGSESPITLAANRCYMSSSISTAKAPYFSLSMGDDMATAIEAVAEETAETAGGAIYDLSGRKVSKAQKGIYIKDGKKVIIK